MNKTVKMISANIERLRELKGLSQKEVAVAMGIPQGQYSRIENAKVEPTVSTLERMAKVFEVSITEFFKSADPDADKHLPLLEKVKRINALDKDERKAIETVIDMAISRKNLKENITNMLHQSKF